MDTPVRALLAGVLVVIAALLAGSAPAASTGPGTFDTSFGSGGKAFADFGGATDVEMAVDLGLQDNGRVTAVGTLTTDGATRWAVARWRGDGQLDNGFGNRGRAVTAVGSADSAHAVALHDYGKALVGGASDGRFALVAYTSHGGLDTSWGGDGIVTTELQAGPGVVLDVRVLGDGSVIAAGPAGDRLAIARYAADGALDPAYGVGGIVTSAQPFGGDVFGVQLQPDGGLFATGTSEPDQDSIAGVRTVRIDADGLPDPAFGTGGGVTTNTGTAEVSLGRAVVVQPDGRVLVAGSAFGEGDYRHYLVVRYLPDGSLDPSFGGGGYLNPLFDYYAQANGVALQPNGKIVTTGWTAGEDPHRVVVARYSASGVPDTSFNAKGYRTIGVGTYAEGMAVALSGGRIYSVGGLAGGDAAFLALRLRR